MEQPQTRRGYLDGFMDVFESLLPGLMVGLLVGLVFSTFQMIYILETVDKSGFDICVKDR